MYHVVYLKDESVIVYPYKSHVEKHCWNFIYQRLTHTNSKIRENALYLYVIDAMEQFCDPPPEVKALQNYTKLMVEVA